MSVIVEAALSSFFQVLLDKISSTELLNFATEAQVYDEIQGWKFKLQTLYAVLDDAEDKQIQSRPVKLWLGELKHLAYDVEDLLDEFATECLCRKLKGGEHHLDTAASSSKIHKLVPACCTCFNPRVLMFNTEMMSKIKDITVRFEVILKEMQQLNLLVHVGTTSAKVSQRPPSSCLPDEPKVYGRDGDKDKILELLFKYVAEDDAQVGVIPIVGMGGMGKTTLARLVYNDDLLLDHHFQVKAWVCVSDVFDLAKVTNDILGSITSQTTNLTQLSDLQLQLNRELIGKKFLLVLDDVWTDNHDDWHALRPPLMNGAPGSKIIVTTRSTDVAKMLGTVDYYELKKISDEDCWLLFKKHAFDNRSSVAQSELEEIGREIVSKRCDGLPLAARTLGGLLRRKERPHEWEEVLNNKLWSVLSVLELSYYYLPSHLKRCFDYCAILPKDYEFKQEDIILLWMAEGLIPQSNDGRRMEDLGGDYFHDLLSRSFFQKSTVDQSKFVMHDLVNDLAQKVAGDLCLKLEESSVVGEEVQSGRVRHSSYIQTRGNIEATKRFAPFHNMKCLRTFLPLSRDRLYRYVANCVPDELLRNLTSLRVLSFRGYHIKELPDSIGDLKHLRYLDLSFNEIKLLPDSITWLCNLQTLFLIECKNLKKLPVRMDNLTNLRYLDMNGVCLTEGIPLEIRDLINLRALCNIVVDSEFFPLSNLMSLKSLRGQLSLIKLNTVVDASDAVNAKLKDKKGIRVLLLRWETFNDGLEDAGVHYDVLEGLQPHQNIAKLIVVGYGGTKFPSWIGDLMFNKMVQIRLENCHKCTLLPRLGMLPNLKELFIKGMSSLERVDQDLFGNNAFPRLEVLHFEMMDNWEEWNAFEFEFQKLQKLSVRNCEKLVAALPSLPMLSVLDIRSCKEVDFKSIVDFNSLSMVFLDGISIITNFSMESFLQRLKKLREIEVSRSDSNWELKSNWGWKIANCPQLTGMIVDEDKEELKMKFVGSEIKALKLEGCGMLEKCESLIRLEISKCQSLSKIAVYSSQCLKVLTISECELVMSLGRRQLPSTLKTLLISKCKNLKSLLDEDDESANCSSTTSLGHLEIESCQSLTSFSSTMELPTTLKHLYIYRCSNLTYVIPTGKLPSGLQSLKIKNCVKIESVAEEFDSNSSLETLVIEKCSSLETLPEGLDSLIKLGEFQLHDCSCVVSFRLPTTSLAKLDSDKLPDNLQTLSSLQVLNIPLCPSMPDEGLPSNLTSLSISSKHLHCCRLERLHSLRGLSIYGGPGDMRRALWDKSGTIFPLSLARLQFTVFPNLRHISTGPFRNLPSLESLRINSCPKLASFSKNSLPNSMLELVVHGCPMLKQRCKEGKRPEWSKIRHIPKVEFY